MFWVFFYIKSDLYNINLLNYTHCNGLKHLTFLEIYILIFSEWSHAPFALHPDAKEHSLAGTVWGCDVLCSILDLSSLFKLFLWLKYFCAIFKHLISYCNFLKKCQQYNMLFTYHLKKVNNYPSKPQPHNALKHQHTGSECHISLFSTIL